MPEGFLMGFDVGGGSGRCLLLDAERFETVVATRSYRHPLAPNTGGLSALWRLLGEAAREVMARAGAEPGQVLGLAASSMRFATVLLGRGGEALLATPNRDARAGLEALRLATEHGEALQARTGHWPSPICGAPRLAWLANARPGCLAHAEALLGLGDWVTWRLCGELVPCGTRAGRLRSDAAAALGLLPGVPVGVCGADTPAGLLGAGVASAGEAGVIAGTTSPVQLLLAEPFVDPRGRLWTEHHPVSNLWALESNAGPSGEALDWFARLLHPDSAHPVSRILAEAATSEPGAALDVFALEPPGADHPLLAHANLIATSHVGGNTEEVSVHQGAIVVEELALLLRGERPRHVLNPETLEHFDWEEPRTTPKPGVLGALSRRQAPAVTDLQAAPAAMDLPAVPAGTDLQAVPPVAAAPSVPARASAPSLRPGVERVLRAFCARIQDDPAVRSLARGRSVTLQFALTDLDLEFFLRLRDDVVRAGLGRADGAPDVRLRMKARVLDGMFSGRVSGMDMAMKGELFFAGDAARAMTLQHLQADLQRLYRAACEETGGTGDLDAIAPGNPADGPAAPLGGDDPRLALIAVVRELHAAHLVTATGGNVSVRAAGQEALWITPSQLFKGDLRPELLVRMDLAGEPLDPDSRSPSSERLMHCAAYAARPEATAVVHAHAKNATILANAGLPFLPISTEAAFFGEIPRVPFLMPGTKELADAVAAALQDSWAVLMQNHGLLVAGRSLRRAADMVEIIERSSEVLLGCRAVGREPPLLPDDVVRQLRQMGDLVA
jgi:ribulose-5-phosphate 4-epimerase/fuculose-1-phosphate aldolase